MNEQIMVFSKEWFKKHNKTLCWFANAPIIKYWFRWLLRIHKDIPWNEKIEEIMPNAFTYGKKLVLTKEGLREQRTTDFRTHEKFGKRLYYGLKPFWYLLHFWDWSTSIQPVLNVGFDTLTVYPVPGTTVDGQVARLSVDESFATIIAGDGTFSSHTNTHGDIACRSSTTNDQFTQMRRWIGLFDTSTLTSSATISGAILSVWGISKYNNLGSPDLHVCSSNPTSNTVLATSDYGNIGSTSFGSIAYADFDGTNTQYNAITLNAYGIAAISKTSLTKLGLRLSWDIGSSFGGSWASNTNSGFQIDYASYTGTDRDPKLVVTYTLPVTFIPRTMWFN